MAIPTLFNHFHTDNKKTKNRLKWDMIMSIIALIVILGYGIVSVIDLLTTVSYEGVCSNSVDAKILCDDWSFRQCSYFGESVGAKGVGPTGNNPAPNKDDCVPIGGGECEIHDFTSPNFCTNYKGGKFDGVELYRYLWTGNVGDEVVELKGVATGDNYMCCGQIEQTIVQKLVVWVGIIGGAAGVIMKIVGVIPPFGCVNSDGAVENVQEEEIPVNTV